jgi:uncharacterized protein (TIGR03435 family)
MQKLCIVLGTGALIAFAQSPSETKTPLTFDVISVKASAPDANGGMIRPTGSQRYVATNVPLRLMMKLMYRITDSQIVGAPAWMDNQRWDVEAKAEHPSNIDQLHEMFQTLLADRFQLKFHKERRELSALVLSVDKSGSKLKPSESQDWTDIPIKPAGPGKIVGTRVPIPYFCWFLSQQANIPVVDNTRLAGVYDFTLQLPPPQPGAEGPGGRGAEPAPQDRMADAFAALREQLGLKLESRKAPVEVFVIDHVERPAAN